MIDVYLSNGLRWPNSDSFMVGVMELKVSRLIRM